MYNIGIKRNRKNLTHNSEHVLFCTDCEETKYNGMDTKEDEIVELFNELTACLKKQPTSYSQLRKTEYVRNNIAIEQLRAQTRI